MKLNPLKCTFGIKIGKFLGYLVSHRGIEANLDKIKAILDMAAPKSTKEVQKLTGRVAALNRFVSRMAQKCLPFFKVLRGKTRSQWGPDCEKAFQEFKNDLTEPPSRVSPRPDETLFLYLYLAAATDS